MQEGFLDIEKKLKKLGDETLPMLVETLTTAEQLLGESIAASLQVEDPGSEKHAKLLASFLELQEAKPENEAEREFLESLDEKPVDLQAEWDSQEVIDQGLFDKGAMKKKRERQVKLEESAPKLQCKLEESATSMSIKYEHIEQSTSHSSKYEQSFDQSTFHSYKYEQKLEKSASHRSRTQGREKDEKTQSWWQNSWQKEDEKAQEWW